MKKLLFALIASSVLAACTHGAPVITPSSEQNSTTPTTECGIESCHGLDIICGPAVPEMCTYEYRLGDFCRQFAECGMVAGDCRFIENELFAACKNCVEQCDTSDTDEDTFQCEELCQLQFELSN